MLPTTFKTSAGILPGRRKQLGNRLRRGQAQFGKDRIERNRIAPLGIQHTAGDTERDDRRAGEGFQETACIGSKGVALAGALTGGTGTGGRSLSAGHAAMKRNGTA